MCRHGHSSEIVGFVHGSLIINNVLFCIVRGELTRTLRRCDMQSRNVNSSVDTLRSTIEPPPEHIIAASLQELSSLGAIREDGSCNVFPPKHTIFTPRLILSHPCQAPSPTLALLCVPFPSNHASRCCCSTAHSSVVSAPFSRLQLLSSLGLSFLPAANRAAPA